MTKSRFRPFFRPLYRRIGCLALVLSPVICAGVLALLYLLFPPAPATLLILGVDARSGQEYATRADSILLLRIDPGGRRVSVLSIPRDVFIRVPGYGEQRINTLNVLGEQEAGNGPALMQASLQETFGIVVDHSIRLDFSDFAALIDAAGGIDIDVPELIVDQAYPTPDGGTMTVRFEPGRQHLNGTQALQYARTRHQDDDFHRAARQQQIVDAFLKKLSDPRQIAQWPRVWKAVRSHTNLSAWDMARLGPALLLGWPDRSQRVLEGQDLIELKKGYWIPNIPEIQPWIKAHFG